VASSSSCHEFCTPGNCTLNGLPTLASIKPFFIGTKGATGVLSRRSKTGVVLTVKYAGATFQRLLALS
jgi:hypothetical protein